MVLCRGGVLHGQTENARALAERKRELVELCGLLRRDLASSCLLAARDGFLSFRI